MPRLQSCLAKRYDHSSQLPRMHLLIVEAIVAQTHIVPSTSKLRRRPTAPECFFCDVAAR